MAVELDRQVQRDVAEPEGSVDVLTADALHVNTKVTVTFRPRRDQIYRVAAEIGRNSYEQVIQPAFSTLPRSEFARHARLGGSDLRAGLPGTGAPSSVRLS